MMVAVRGANVAEPEDHMVHSAGTNGVTPNSPSVTTMILTPRLSPEDWWTWSMWPMCYAFPSAWASAAKGCSTKPRQEPSGAWV